MHDVLNRNLHHVEKYRHGCTRTDSEISSLLRALTCF